MDDNTAYTCVTTLVVVALCFIVGTCFSTIHEEHMANYGYQQVENGNGKRMWVQVPKEDKSQEDTSK